MPCRGRTGDKRGEGKTRSSMCRSVYASPTAMKRQNPGHEKNCPNRQTILYHVPDSSGFLERISGNKVRKNRSLPPSVIPTDAGRMGNESRYLPPRRNAKRMRTVDLRSNPGRNRRMNLLAKRLSNILLDR